MTSRGSPGALVYHDLSCQKSQNAYETGGVLREKKNKSKRFRRKKRKYILKKIQSRRSCQVVQCSGQALRLRLRTRRSGLNAARPRFCWTQNRFKEEEEEEEKEIKREEEGKKQLLFNPGMSSFHPPTHYVNKAGVSALPPALTCSGSSRRRAP